ncbi:MAG: cardiolipin synthase [Novosphingobium sp.]
MPETLTAWLVTLATIALDTVFIVRAVIRPNREPAARLAWVLVILLLPAVGIVGYLLLGEVDLGRRRREGLAGLIAILPRPNGAAEHPQPPEGDRYTPPFALAREVNRLAPTSGNAVTVHADPAATLAALIADIDGAQSSVHACFYIWLDDETGTAIARALTRAAQRGVEVRAMADGVGSRAFIASRLWQAMRAEGVRLRVALKVTRPVPRILFRRIDLRNHRKAVIVDNALVWVGSMNAADPAFRIKPRYGPWIDLMLRCAGPAAQQAQYLFALDWMAEGGDDLADTLTPSHEVPTGGVAAQVIGTGPTHQYAAMSECFAALAHCAVRELLITTPYFVPDDPLLSAIVSCARRGVATTLIVPERNDSRLVAGASCSSYAALLDAGVQLHHFPDGLLHAKTVTVDGELALVGSANMDRRSLDLNYENNLLLRDRATVAEIRAHQLGWLARSHPVSRAEVARWGVTQRLWHNLLAMLSPIL